MPVQIYLYYGTHSVPLGTQLNLNEYGIYHQIAETISFNMVYNLLLKGWG